ncbi:MAG: hexosaminidase [Pseudohongiellaceae bacterium]
MLAFALSAVLSPFDEPDAPQLVPSPASMSVSAGRFDLTAATAIAFQGTSTGARDVGRLLAEVLAGGLGRPPGLEAAEGPEAQRDTILLTTVGADPELGPEGYTLDVTSASIVIRAPEVAGLFRGTQTLRQLLPASFESALSSGGSMSQVPLPLVSIRDAPRYPWRGLLLDCGREFMSVEFIKRTIDLLAYHRMNVLHWHLVEDQGWRLEIDAYPKLTEVGAWRGQGDERTGGFYTQEDVREIVAYAAQRHITVVPEIELPGHCVAALASYPELACSDVPLDVSTVWGVHADVYCAGKETTFEFLTGVLEETLELFPSEFIHIGGDEVPKTRWEQCQDCQRRIVELGLADEEALQNWFVGRIGQWLNERGRRLVGWDEILEGTTKAAGRGAFQGDDIAGDAAAADGAVVAGTEWKAGLPDGAVVQSWRGMSGAKEAARLGHDVIASPTSHCYLDYAHDVIDLERIYSFEPTPPNLSYEEAAHILGAEGNMWTEHAPEALVDGMVWPRLCALAEVTWTPAEQRSYFDFYGRMRTHYERLESLGVQYYVAPPTMMPSDRVFEDSLEIRFGNPTGRGVVRFTLDGSEPTADSEVFQDLPILWRDTVVQAAVFLDDGRRGQVARWEFERQAPRESLLLLSPSPALEYRVYRGRWEQLPDFDALEPVASGLCEGPSLSFVGQGDGFALVFDGYIAIPEEGAWSFHLSSDDGSRLWIGDELIVDHDGLHRATTRVGQRLLRAGYHPVRLAMFNASGEAQLSLQWQGPGQLKPELIPRGGWQVSQR